MIINFGLKKMHLSITIPKEKYLWKFLDLYKFLAFIKSKLFYFSSLNDLDDVLEFCSKDMAYLVRYHLNTAEIRKGKRNPAIEPEFFEDKGLRFLNLLEELRRFRLDRFVNCFYAADNESVAMWNLYSGVQGIAVRYSAKSLLNYIENYYKENLKDLYSLTSNYVKYDNILNHQVYDEQGGIKNADDNFTFNPFIKDKSYIHEKEYRILIFQKNSNDDPPIININSWNDIEFKIFAHSDLEDWKVDLINNFLLDYELTTEIEKSSIITPGIVNKYKNKYLEKVVKEKGGYLH